MENIDTVIEQVRQQEKRAKKRAVIFTFIPVLVGIVLIYFTSLKIFDAQKELTDIKEDVNRLTLLRDSIRIEYLEAKGFSLSERKELLGESINADNLISQLLKQGSIDTTIQIRYYRKSLDQEKVWLSLKELGYKNIKELESTNPVLINDETNSVAIGSGVPLFDAKIIALTLVRAGFKVQHLYYAQKNKDIKDLVQIIRTAPANGSPDKSPTISVDQIRKATNISQLLHK